MKTISFSREDMERLAPVVRVVVAETKGSVPREVGASMLVHRGGVDGTIGGGALEFEAIARARSVLESGADRLDRVALGPGVGQCCGGAVTLLSEVWTDARLAGLGNVVARVVPGVDAVPSLKVKRILAAARNAGDVPAPGLVDGWMIEPVTQPSRHIWVWGAGHVGRAIVHVLSPVPEIKVFWADTDRSRFPDVVPEGVEVLLAENPADLASLAAPEAEHLVLTYSHALDLELCHRILGRSFGSLGLIGSATKWARFRSRLLALGHGVPHVERIACPIGDPLLGKHPAAIALGVSTELLKVSVAGNSVKERAL